MGDPNIWDDEKGRHHGSEQLLILLRGRPTLRTFAGERPLEEGGERLFVIHDVKEQEA
jgi:hypothetical protein